MTDDRTQEWTPVQEERLGDLSGQLSRAARGQELREAKINRGQGIVGEYTLAYWERLVDQAREEDDPELFLMACLISHRRTARILRIKDADVQNLREKLYASPQA